MNALSFWLALLLMVPAAASSPPAYSQTASTQPEANRFEQALQRHALQGGDPAPWRTWQAQEAAALRHWSSQPRDNAAWVGGWPHDHANATTGRHLPWSVDTPRPSELINGGRVASGWVAITREYNLRQVLGAARQAHWLGRADLGQWAARELDTYAQLYTTQPVRGRKERSVLFTESLQEAVVLPALLEAIRLLGHSSSAAQQQRWRDALVAPMVANLMASQHEISNKSVWRTAAVALAAEQYDRADWRQFAHQGTWSFEHQMATALSPDGHWFELSLQYQAYVLRALAEYAAGMRAMQAQARIDPHALAALQAMAQSLLRMRYANGEAPLINDSQPGRQVPTAELHALLQLAWPQLPAAHGMEPAPASWITWATRVVSRTHPGQPLPAYEDGAVALAGLHSVQWQQGPWRALLRAGQGARFHAHQDALSLELMYRDEWVWRNPGTLAYGTRLHGAYLRKAGAHSGPLVGDAGASQWFARPSDLSRTPEAAMAEFVGFRPASTVRRSISGSVSGTVSGHTDVLVDELAFSSRGDPSSHGSVFHTPCVLHLPPAPQTPAGHQPPATPVHEALAFMQLRHWGRVQGTWPLGLTCGAYRLRADFALSAPAEVWIGLSPGGPPSGPLRTAIYLRMTGEPRTHLQVRLWADSNQEKP